MLEISVMIRQILKVARQVEALEWMELSDKPAVSLRCQELALRGVAGPVATAIIVNASKLLASSTAVVPTAPASHMPWLSCSSSAQMLLDGSTCALATAAAAARKSTTQLIRA